MKNEKMVRNYWGYYFIFESIESAGKFVNDYENLGEFEFEIINGRPVVKLICGKGVIPEIRKNFGKKLKVESRRYYISD